MINRNNEFISIIMEGNFTGVIQKRHRKKEENYQGFSMMTQEG